MAWYPFNGDLKNNGDSSYDLTSSSTPTYGTGKIGKAINFSKNFLKAEKSPFKNTTTYSICGWVYLNSLNSNNTIICSRTEIGLGTSIFILGNKMRIDASIGVADASNQWTTSYGFEANKWTHFVVTNNNGNISYYINGKLQQTKEIASTIQYIGDYVTIGASSEGNTNLGSNNYLNGKLNDLRIYDHVLSQAEIQEIYRTLILKYSFDIPAEDPVISTVRAIDISNWLNGKENMCPAIGDIIYNKNYFITGNYFTISFDLNIKDVTTTSEKRNLARIGLQDQTSIDGIAKWSTITNPDNELNKRPNQLGNFLGDKEINLSKNGTYHISRTYKLGDMSKHKFNSTIEIRCDYLFSGTIEISNYKVVLGKEEILSDGTDGMVYDESGMGNLAEVIKMDNFPSALCYSTESKIGKGCFQFKSKMDDQENTSVIVKTKKIFYEVPEISIAFWLYVPEIDYSNQDNSILGCSMRAENYGVWIRRNGISLTAQVYHMALGVNGLKRSQWNYVVITAQKQGDLKIYLDGELIGTKNITGANWENSYLTIGDLRLGRGLKLDGKVDDLKIYSTILDEEYIKKEYNEKIKIDNKGNLYCSELVENNSNNIFSFDNVLNYRELPNIKEAFFDDNSLVVISKDGAGDARYFRVKMKFSAGSYRVYRIYNIIGNNSTDTTGRFFISSIDWSKNFLMINKNDNYGVMTFTEDTETYMTFVASERDPNTAEIAVQFLLYIYANDKQEFQEIKFLGNGEIKTYNLRENEEKIGKIFNKQKTIQTQNLYEY